MLLLRKHNTITAPLKYPKKPTEEIITLLILIVGLMQMQIFNSRLPNAWQ